MLLVALLPSRYQIKHVAHIADESGWKGTGRAIEDRARAVGYQTRGLPLMVTTVYKYRYTFDQSS